MRKNSADEIGKLIEVRFRDADFCVKSICHEIGISMSSLHEFLSFRYGTTPHELIEERRLMEALRLMKSNHSSLGAIVRACGFASMRTFRRVFRKRIGMAPSEANEKLRSQSDKEVFHIECVRKLSETGSSTLGFEELEEMTADFDRKNCILPGA